MLQCYLYVDVDPQAWTFAAVVLQCNCCVVCVAVILSTMISIVNLYLLFLTAIDTGVGASYWTYAMWFIWSPWSLYFSVIFLFALQSLN